MRNFIGIFKLQLKNMFRRDQTKNNRAKTIGIIALVVVLYGALVGFFIYAMRDIVPNIIALNIETEFVTVIFMAALVMVFFFGIVSLLACLYFSKDSEFFLALPVRPSVVFAAKVAVVYLIELFTAALLMLPILITVGVMMQVSAAFYIIMPFAILFLPAIPLFVASILAIPVMYIVSFFRNRGAIGSIFGLLLLGGLFAAYYVFVSKLQNMTFEDLNPESVRATTEKIAQYVYPVYALSKAMMLNGVFGLSISVSVSVNLLIFLGCVVVFGAAAMLISAAVYRKGASAQIEGRKKSKATVGEYRNSGSLKSLMKKEWREIIRTPAFAMNCLLPIVLCAVMLGFVGFSFSANGVFDAVNEVSDSEDAVGIVAGAVIDAIFFVVRYIMLGLGMFMGFASNTAAATAFSREGEKLYFSKIIPVDYVTQVKAKALVYIIIGSVTSLVASAVTAMFGFDIVFFVCSFLFMVILNIALVHFGLWLDLGRPKIKWVTPNEAMKHNRNAGIYVVVAMFVTIAFALLGGFTGVNFYLKWGNWGLVLSWTIMFVAVITLAVLGAAFLYKDCGKMFEKIDL